MTGLLLALVLASGPGARFGSAGSPVTPGSMGGAFAGSTVDEPRATLIAPREGTLTRIHLEKTVAGTGAGTFTLAVTADGVTACSVDVACTGTGSASGTCTGTFAAEADLHLEITASACSALPDFIASALWEW